MPKTLSVLAAIIVASMLVIPTVSLADVPQSAPVTISA
jgi:hypothetical protein